MDLFKSTRTPHTGPPNHQNLPTHPQDDRIEFVFNNTAVVKLSLTRTLTSTASHFPSIAIKRSSDKTRHVWGQIILLIK